MGHTSSYCVLSIPIGRYLIKSYITQPGQPLEPRFSDLYNYLGVCVSSTQTPQVISRIVRTHMTNIDPVSVSSDGEVYAVSSSSGRAAARVISVMSSCRNRVLERIPEDNLKVKSKSRSKRLPEGWLAQACQLQCARGVRRPVARSVRRQCAHAVCAGRVHAACTE